MANMDILNSTHNLKEKVNEHLFMFEVSVLNSILCTAGIWFWCGWGHLTQEQGGKCKGMGYCMGYHSCVYHRFWGIPTQLHFLHAAQSGRRAAS